MRFVNRERLRLLLDAAPEARLVLVSAPAGFGKSTLLADWLAGGDVRRAWLSLDPGDNDVVRFCRNLAAAAGGLAGSPEDGGALEGAQAFDPEIALAGVLDRITLAVDGRPGAPAGAGAANGPGHGAGAGASGGGASGGGASGAVLVLDDYHVIDEPAIHRLVALLVDRLPGGARLAIATRADPPLPLARLRAGGELLEVRAEDLRFSAAEAGELLRSTGAELGPSEIDELTARTEGWAAALRLAALSLRGRANHAEVVRQFGASHRYILDYVLEEVLARLPPETEAFLLRTSLLERLTGPLCEAVAGEADGQAQLEELERANLLIVPLDDERRWYRYHALFAEILRARLARLFPEEVAGLHERASTWFEEHGYDDEAVGHALRTGDLERLSRIVAEASGRHVNAGELSTVRRWLDALPPELVRDHAQLGASYVWCQLLVGETEGVAERLADAERAFEAGRDGGPAMRPAIPIQLALLRSQLAGLQGDVETAIAQARLARGLVPAGLPIAAEATLRGTAAALFAVALARSGDLDAAAEAYREALPDLRAGGNAFAVGRTIGDLARIAITRGEPARAVALCESELQRNDAVAGATPSAPVWVALARARFELGEVERAAAAARRSLELAGRAGDAHVARTAQVILDEIERSAAVRPDGNRRREPDDGRPVEALTDREVEVLRLVAIGRSNQQIASELFVTVGTVKSHLHTISGKLGAASRVEAAARGRELGLLG